MPQIDPREVRPSRGWFVVAGIIALLGLLAAPVLIALGVGAVTSIADDLPTIKTEFGTRTPTTVELTADKPWAIYVERPDALGSASAQPSASYGSTPLIGAICTADAVGGGSIDLTRSTYSSTTSLQGKSWQQVYQVKVSQNGQYEISCRVTDDATTASGFAIGEDIELDGFLAKLLGGTGAFFGAFLFPCVGLIIGGIIALTVGLMRSSNRKRLQQQRMGYGYGHPAPPYR